MPASPDTSSSRRAQWARSKETGPKVGHLGAGWVAGCLVLAALVGCSSRDTLGSTASGGAVTTTAPDRPTTTRAPVPTTTSTTTTSTTTTSTTTSTTTTVPPPPAVPIADISLRKGDEGDAVLDLEHRLLAAGYWLDNVDGVFDESTHHAVVAVQKTANLERNGVVDLMTLLALSTPPPAAPRSTVGTVVEVDIARQVMFVVRDGLVAETFDVSTGRRPGWTPAGEHAVTREIDGIRNAPLGRLYRPKYFVGGVAVHGYPKVPPEPASHGCVRVTNAVMDHIWESDLLPKGTPVWVY